MINSRFVVQASHLWTSFFQFFTCFSLFTAETVVTVEELVVNTKLSPPNSHFKAALLTDYTTATASSSMTRSCLSFWRKRFFDGFEKEKVNGCSLVQGKTGCAGEKGLGFLCRWRGWCLWKKGFLSLIENHDVLQGVKDGSLQYAVGLAKGPPVGPLYGFMSWALVFYENLFVAWSWFLGLACA